MKIELKNVKHAAFNSEETDCFRATVLIDGVVAGEVSNEGHGGPDDFHPWKLAERLNAYGATLPPTVSEDLRDPNDPTKPFTSKQDAESLIGDLFTEWLITRDLKKRIAKKMLFTIKGKKGVFAVSFKQPQALEAIVRDKGMLAAFAERHKAERILNTLPLEEALQIFRATT